MGRISMVQFASTVIPLATPVLVRPQVARNAFLAISSTQLLLLAKFAQETASPAVAVDFVSLAPRASPKTMALAEAALFHVLIALR